jgi:hypothetical protein
VNYAAIPADLLETIFVVVRNTRSPNMSQTSPTELALKVLSSNIRIDAESGGKGN